MVEHYFQQPLTDEQKSRIDAALSIPLKSTPSAFKMYGDKGFTPAEVFNIYLCHFVIILFIIIVFTVIFFYSWSNFVQNMMILMIF